MAETLIALGAGASTAATTVGSAVASVVANPWVTTAVSLGSAGLRLASGASQSTAMKQQAEIARFEAEQETLRGQQEANNVRDRLIRTLASQRAGYAAGGVDIGDGSSVDVMTDTAATGERELQIVRGNAAARAAAKNAQGDQFSSGARSAMIGGVAGAAGSLFDLVDRRSSNAGGTVTRGRTGGTSTGRFPGPV